MTTLCEQHQTPNVAFFLSLLCIGLFGCSEGSSDDADSFVQRDSAGIQITESSAPLWSEADAWVLDSVPTVRIGGEVEDSVPLVGVARARVMADGRVVVANGRRGINEVLMFDSLGNFVQVIGRSGEGPGEFSRVDDMYKCAGDTLVVNDFSRMIFFDSQGEHVRTSRLLQTGIGGRRWIKGITGDCSTWFVETYVRDVPRHGTVGLQYSILTWGTLDESISDTITTVPIGKVYNRIYPGWDNLPVTIPWTQMSSRASGENSAFVGLTDRPEIRVYGNGGGLAQIIRWTQPPSPVTGADRQLFAQQREYWLPKVPPLKEVLPPLDEYPDLPSHKPLFRALLSDDEGNLWVRGYPDFVSGLPILWDVGGQLWEGEENGDEIEDWRVFDPEGRLLGMVHIPAGVQVLAVERGFVITLSADDLGIEAVELYKLKKGAGAI